MYKNQLQELAQRSCFNLPSYSCIREGPDHAPRFKATVNFNGETFESPQYCTTLRQAEHSAAEVALNALANRGSSNSLAARILDETGVYKNLLQEVSQRVGASLPAYTTFRSGLGHLPVFTGTVELAGVIFRGEPAKNKKQAEKNAAMSAWSSLKLLAQQSESSMPPDRGRNDEQEHVTVARALHKFLIKAKLARIPFPINFSAPTPRPSNNTQQVTATTSKILPLICPRTVTHNRPLSPGCLRPTSAQTRPNLAEKFPAASAAPYIPIRHFGPHHRVAPPVTIRSAIPVFSAPPLPQSPKVVGPTMPGMAPSVSIRHVAPVNATPPPVRAEELSNAKELSSSKALPDKSPEIRVHDQQPKPASERAEEPPGNLGTVSEEKQVAVKEEKQQQEEEKQEIEELKQLKI
ncbi:hypothetical protein DM860_009252 [Cuscuta australis]|uniref:DRBM domain-containing protein n=1 Tax=Cuscuta australis TaxID=267555 RepID=A0A328DAJ4_9ASTE|nr:hypothetical protein DM860_009252 [Cuscuta australis]